jgi:hypothetical protein
MSEIQQKKSIDKSEAEEEIKEDKILIDLLKQFETIGIKYNRRLAEIYKKHGVKMPGFKLSPK